MRFKISNDARPQAVTLLIAALISIALWFIPFAEILSYPFRIFVTFIHEGGHAIAALITGNSVQSLSVAINASGETYTSQGGTFSQMLVASAGYLGAMTYGAILLVLIRKAVAARIVLVGSAFIILILVVVFGLINPLISGAWGSVSGIPFTLFAGIALAIGLLLVARFASARVATFVVSLLAVLVRSDLSKDAELLVLRHRTRCYAASSAAACGGIVPTGSGLRRCPGW